VAPTPTTRSEVRPTPTTRSEVGPTPSPGTSTFQVEVDGQTITADSLPSPEAYYAGLLAKHGKDLSPCKLAPTPQPGTCPRPSSLGEIELKQQINVELILDASGSMAEPAGGEAKMAAAKRVLTDFIGTLPSTANVALRVYGHKGTSADADKAVSCGASELLYPFQPLDPSRFRAAIQSFQPSGWTPLAASLDQARDDFARADPANSSNFVYVVTDGVETCDGDPVAASSALHAASVQPIVNVVGFDVDAAAGEQLRRAAESGGGKYYDAHSADELGSVFGSKLDWAAWTAYYNCLYAAANSRYNTITADQNSRYNCVLSRINDEYNDLLADVNQRYNHLMSAANRRYNEISRAGSQADPAAVASAKQGWQRLSARAQENWDYATRREGARWDSISRASASEWDDAIGKAEHEWDQAMKDLDQQQRGTRP
jgi:hypothetical protein